MKKDKDLAPLRSHDDPGAPGLLAELEEKAQQSDGEKGRQPEKKEEKK